MNNEHQSATTIISSSHCWLSRRSLLGSWSFPISRTCLRRKAGILVDVVRSLSIRNHCHTQHTQFHRCKAQVSSTCTCASTPRSGLLGKAFVRSEVVLQCWVVSARYDYFYHPNAGFVTSYSIMMSLVWLFPRSHGKEKLGEEPDFAKASYYFNPITDMWVMLSLVACIFVCNSWHDIFDKNDKKINFLQSEDLERKRREKDTQHLTHATNGQMKKKYLSWGISKMPLRLWEI